MAPAMIVSMPADRLDTLEPKKIHPFFGGRPVESTPPPSLPGPYAAPIAGQEVEQPVHGDSDGSVSQKRKRRKTAAEADDSEPTSKKKRGRRPGPNIADLLIRKDKEDEGSTAGSGHGLGGSYDDVSTPAALAFCATVNPGPSALPSADDATSKPPRPFTPPAPPTEVMKVLKFNPQTGTLGPPPKNPTKIVTIKLGNDDASRKTIGERIVSILSGERPAEDPGRPLPKKRGRPRKIVNDAEPHPTKPTNPEPKAKPEQTASATTRTDSGLATPTKSTHPFFTGAIAKKAPEARDRAGQSAVTPVSLPSRPTISTVNPHSPRKPGPAPPAARLPQFGVRPAGIKVPGARHPAWPPKGTVHVRDPPPPVRKEAATSVLAGLSGKKAKGQAVAVTPEDDILELLCRRLQFQELCRQDVTSPSSRAMLRLPRKHLESGKQLRSRMLPELRTYRPAPPPDMDELAWSPGFGKCHPAVARLYDLLGTNLSAFDRSDCENADWAHKYAPGTAAEVLQDARECDALKDWLTTLKVQSVDTGAADLARGGGSGIRAPAKKKRKKNKLDGFIISSEDEDELDDEWMAIDGSDDATKSVVRSCSTTAIPGTGSPRRLPNAVVISGSHGCGKTAAVYAVARELDYEIFEINSSTRRSGRDMMEKVGDMTRNHLVQHHRTDQSLSTPRQGSDAADAVGEEDDVARDIRAGTQGTMMSFFKPKDLGEKEMPKKRGRKPNAPTESPPREKKVPKDQKQSLILIEEADVLFDEDKQFWTTLTSMIAQSRRPFILTCTDESLVPLPTLNLYGVFRFVPPPVDLAVDVLLLVAANEGHSLRRAAAEGLYESRTRDLRASLAELNYWCQIGVGDLRGGFDWFYPRWPRGRDLDEHGDIVRVISDGTYVEGMGWLGRDDARGVLSPAHAEEELARQVVQCWDIDLPAYHLSEEVPVRAQQHRASAAGPAPAALHSYDLLCEAMSAADLASSGGYGSGFREPVDATMPDMPAKVREDFILGLQLIEAPRLEHQDPLHLTIAASLKSLVHDTLPRRVASNGAPPAVGGGGNNNNNNSAFRESSASEALLTSIRPAANHAPLTRHHLNLAFGPIAASERSGGATPASASADPSVFDRTLELIVLDVAPWVRSIVAYDQQLMQERIQKSGLLDDYGMAGGGGGRPGKRMRNTRAAYSALEGGSRAATRRENYFSGGVSAGLVARTAGKEWAAALLEEASRQDPR